MMSTRVAVAAPAVSIDTRFGRFDVREDSIITFPEGLPGFEKSRRFVLLSSEQIAPLWCLHGLDAPEPSFLAVDPALVIAGYRKLLSPDDQLRLGGGGRDCVWLALITIGGGEDAAVNLRAPVVVDAKRMIAVQVIQNRAQYQVNHPLALG
jgi:flagellar assembly factor FliW